MPRVQCHILPSADLLLSLQRVCVVRNKLRHTIIIFNIIRHIPPVFIHHRGLNKQGYQCRGEYYFPCIKVWMSPPSSLSYSSQLPSLSYLECNAAIHKKCIDKVIAKCTGSAINSKETMVGICNFFFQLNKFWSCWYSIFKSFVNLWLSFLQIK